MSTPHTRSDRNWTPELWMQAFKEAVTATLGLVLIVSTVILTYRAFGKAGQQDQMQDAMGILTLLFGLAGVVIGYYFGRIPADARAAEAHGQTEEAVRQTQAAIREQAAATETMSSVAQKTRDMSNRMHETMAEAGVTPRTLDIMNGDQLAPTEMLRTVARDMERELSELEKICERGTAPNSGATALGLQ